MDKVFGRHLMLGDLQYDVGQLERLISWNLLEAKVQRSYGTVRLTGH